MVGLVRYALDMVHGRSAFIHVLMVSASGMHLIWCMDVQHLFMC